MTLPLARVRGGASQEGLASLLGAERMRLHFVVAVEWGRRCGQGNQARRGGCQKTAASSPDGNFFPQIPDVEVGELENVTGVRLLQLCYE
jgi:hypothetical protein